MIKSLRGLFNSANRKETNRSALCAAINARRVIEFSYHGGYRTVEPYALGITMRGDADNESLICYQTGGQNDLDQGGGWKLYRVSEMEEIKLSREQFPGNRPGYDPDNIDMVEIVCRVRLEVPRSVPAGVPPMAPQALTHNERMRRFRFDHPLPGRRPNDKN
jgi:hypothetical protein